MQRPLVDLAEPQHVQAELEDGTEDEERQQEAETTIRRHQGHLVRCEGLLRLLENGQVQHLASDAARYAGCSAQAVDAQVEPQQLDQTLRETLQYYISSPDAYPEDWSAPWWLQRLALTSSCSAWSACSACKSCPPVCAYHLLTPGAAVPIQGCCCAGTQTCMQTCRSWTTWASCLLGRLLTSLLLSRPSPW